MTLSQTEIEALWLSLYVAGVAVVVALPLAVGAALLLARGRFWGQALFNGVIHLPLILPPVVTGYLLLVTFGRRGAVGGWLYDQFGISFAFRWTGAALAAGVMAFPLMVRAVRLAIEAVDPRLEEAARTLGATRTGAFFTITLPLIVPGLISGTIMGFAKALGEFGATITFVSNIAGETQTLPLAIYTALQIPDGEGMAARLVALSVGLAMGALFLSEVLARRVARRIAGQTTTRPAPAKGPR